jgi:predicted HTH transcriptional regulator
MNWKERAVKYLKNSLYPVPSELNGIDWKSGLSSKSDRLAQHLCAFSNQEGGGFLVYGVNNDATLASITREQSDEIIGRLGNIARNNLIPPIPLEHATLDINGNSLLFIHIPENPEKPV